MSTIPRLTYRHANQIHFIWPSNPNVREYIVGAANTLDTAQSGSTEMFRVRNNGHFRSVGIAKKRLGITDESRRNLTSAVFDLEDYFAVGDPIPHDDQVAFVRVTEVSVAGVEGSEGPILVVPNAETFGMAAPVLTLTGAAAPVDDSDTGIPPDGSLHLVFPRMVQAVQIRNLDADNSIYISFNAGMPMVELPKGAVDQFTFNGTESHLFMRCDSDKTASFAAYVTLVNGRA